MTNSKYRQKHEKYEKLELGTWILSIGFLITSLILCVIGLIYSDTAVAHGGSLLSKMYSAGVYGGFAVFFFVISKVCLKLKKLNHLFELIGTVSEGATGGLLVAAVLFAIGTLAVSLFNIPTATKIGFSTGSHLAYIYLSLSVFTFIVSKMYKKQAKLLTMKHYKQNIDK